MTHDLGRDPDWDDPDEDDGEEGERDRGGHRPQDAWGESEVPDGEPGEDLLKRMARTHAELAMQTLADVAANGDKDAARVAASRELLARGFGMPTRRTEQKVDVKIQDQRAAHFEALKTLAARNPTVQIEDVQDAEFDEIPNARRITDRRNRDDDDE